MSTVRLSRGQRALALVPLAVLSAAWTASIAGVGAGSASADPSGDTRLPDGSTVPTQAITAPASVTSAGGSRSGVPADGGRIIATSSTSGIPAAALAAYQRAETVINSADRSCHLDWQLIAAIGRVESDHGRTNGNTLDGTGVARPGIYGLALDGTHGTSRIADTDAGQYDADARYDRAIGPMQFIPSTWSVVGVDADGDGKRNPQDVDDAALATAVYLCSGNDDLSTVGGQRSAVYRYNHSTSYVDLVMSIASAYRAGEFTSVPNGTTSADYLVPAAPPVAPSGPRGDHHGHHPDGSPSGSSGGGTTTPPPTEQPTAPPSAPAGGGTGGSGGGGDAGGGGGVHVPGTGVSVPPAPSTSVGPVDDLLTVAQAIAQCTLDGYVDNVLSNDDPFDRCVYHYTH